MQYLLGSSRLKYHVNSQENQLLHMQNKQLDVTLKFIHVAFMFEFELFQNQM